MPLIIRELSQEELPSILPFIRQLNPEMTEQSFSALLQQMAAKGYRCAGAFDKRGKLLGIAGFWELCRFWCGPHVDIDNVVTDGEHRGKGIGKALVRALLDHPDLRSVSTWMLNTSDAHELYARFGFRPVIDGNEMRLDR